MGINTLMDTAAMLAVFWALPALIGAGIVFVALKMKGVK